MENNINKYLNNIYGVDNKGKKNISSMKPQPITEIAKIIQKVEGKIEPKKTLKQQQGDDLENKINQVDKIIEDIKSEEVKKKDILINIIDFLKNMYTNEEVIENL